MLSAIGIVLVTSIGYAYMRLCDVLAYRLDVAMLRRQRARYRAARRAAQRFETENTGE